MGTKLGRGVNALQDAEKTTSETKEMLRKHLHVPLCCVIAMMLCVYSEYCAFSRVDDRLQ